MTADVKADGSAGAAGDRDETPSNPIATLPLGVVLRRTPGATRWAKWAWRASAVLPGARPADWRELRREGEAAEYHAATVTLELHRAETEGYIVSLAMKAPSVFVILTPAEDPERGYDVQKVTASAYEAQMFQDGGDQIVEPVPMPPSLRAFIQDFCARRHVETPFVKRKRGDAGPGEAEEGVGDARIRQTSDVYRAPGALKPKAPE